MAETAAVLCVVLCAALLRAADPKRLPLPLRPPLRCTFWGHASRALACVAAGAAFLLWRTVEKGAGAALVVSALLMTTTGLFTLVARWSPWVWGVVAALPLAIASVVAWLAYGH